MVNYLYNSHGSPVGFWMGKYVYTLSGNAVGQLNGHHVQKFSGSYVGELYLDMVVDQQLGNLGNAPPICSAIQFVLVSTQHNDSL